MCKVPKKIGNLESNSFSACLHSWVNKYFGDWKTKQYDKWLEIFPPQPLDSLTYRKFTHKLLFTGGMCQLSINKTKIISWIIKTKLVVELVLKKYFFLHRFDEGGNPPFNFVQFFWRNIKEGGAFPSLVHNFNKIWGEINRLKNF